MQKTRLYKRCLPVIALVLAVSLPLVSLAESYKVVTGGGLNLRKEPSLNASVLGQYPTGTWMTVLETTGDWSKVQVNGKTGYVLSKYLTDSNVSNTLTVRTNTGIGLNVRTAPSLTGDIVTSFKNGSTVTVLSKGNGWYKVQQGDVVGYVASRFLSGNTGSGSTAKPSGKQGVVKNPGANQVLLLRETASTDARVLGYYRNGTAVTILGESGSFSKVLCLAVVSLPTLPLISASLTSSSAKLSSCIFVIKTGNILTPRAMTNITQNTTTAASIYPSPFLSLMIL